jgi:hypothetical protein
MMHHAGKDLLNLVTRALDRGQRRLRGIYEFSSDPDCIYRLSVEGAPRDLKLPDGTVFRKGEPIGIIHLWGDHMPVIPASGITLAWAARMARVLKRSASLLAQHAVSDKSLQSIPAFGHDAFLVHSSANARLLERIGFAVLECMPTDSLHRQVRMGVIRLWTWLLRRAFNRQSIRGIGPGDLQYRAIWMSRRRLLEKYGTDRAIQL